MTEYNQPSRSGGGKTAKGKFKMTIWKKIDEQSAMGTSYIDYINEDETIVKRVWNDGFIEYYECE